MKDGQNMTHIVRTSGYTHDKILTKNIINSLHTEPQKHKVEDRGIKDFLFSWWGIFSQKLNTIGRIWKKKLYQFNVCKNNENYCKIHTHTLCVFEIKTN